ncbi:hypothetical protein R50073_20650 [Maricurvus nonylphenolicus]|uniref:serine/threonine-protein kinase n=1 Tax=Maricurvus nonylphenolicus TaxID=1008307 RepID=UPI0036F320E9
MANRLISWINWRVLVALVATALVLLPTLPKPLQLLSVLDPYLYSLGVRLSVLPAPQLNIKLLAVSPEDIQTLQQDPARETALQQLLQQLSAASKKPVTGLIIDDLPLVHATAAEQVLVDQTDNAQAQALLSSKQQVVEFLKRDTVIVGSRQGIAQALSEEDRIQLETNMIQDYLAWLPDPLQPALKSLGFYPAGELVSVPVLGQEPGRQDQPLLWRQGTNLYSDFVLSLYRQYVAAPDAVWQLGGDLRLASTSIPLSLDGYLAPAFNVNTPAIQALSLKRLGVDHAVTADVMSDLGKAEIIIIGDDENQLRRMAATLISLEHRAFYITPFWHWGLIKLLALLAALYLCVLIPRMRTATALLATCLWLVVLAVVQLGWQIIQWQWLPMGSVMGLLVIGHAVMALWQYQHQRQWQWQLRANQSSVALARQLCREARYEDAQEVLRDTDTAKEVLAILYDIGAQQERKRQFDAAILTYRALLQRKRNFRDVVERLQNLEAMQQPVQSVSLQQSQPDIAKTLVLENSKVNKPVLGRYEIERELGRGAMGVVYLGLDPKITRRVAIKTLSYDNFAPDQLADVKARFFREAEAAGRLSHPNIVTIFDVGEEHDLAFIAMDFIDGRPLSDFSQSGQLLEPVQVYRYMADVAEALDYAHQNDVVHRDIKPSNMLFNTQADKVTVTDFGIAHITDESRTRTGDILGSPLYMSPEQLKGQAVDRSTDIYSLGVTFYQLLSGVLPFTGDNLASLTYNIIHKDFKSVRKCRKDLPASATRIINKAMQKDPAKRFESAKEMAEAIRKSLQKDFAEQLVG